MPDLAVTVAPAAGSFAVALALFQTHRVVTNRRLKWLERAMQAMLVCQVEIAQKMGASNQALDLLREVMRPG